MKMMKIESAFILFYQIVLHPAPFALDIAGKLETTEC